MGSRKYEDIFPVLVYIVQMWPYWKDNKIKVSQLTLAELQLLRAFDNGFETYINNKSASGSSNNSDSYKAQPFPSGLVSGGAISLADLSSDSD